MQYLLLPEIEARQDGAAGPAGIPREAAGVDAGEVIVTVGITQAMERERLRVSIWGSADGEDWGEKPLLEFPAKSYCGRYSIPLNLAQCPGVRQLRATWNLLAWNARQEALFRFYVEVSEERARLPFQTLPPPLSMSAAAAGAA